MIKCGNCKAYCCREAPRLMPELDRGDGICQFLTSDNKCAIYEDRPLICNTDKVYERYFKHLSREEYDKMNTEACNYLLNRGNTNERT